MCRCSKAPILIARVPSRLKTKVTAAISYDELEDMREGDLTPQQVIGRLKLTGDASRAMALGMTLFTPPKKGAASPPGKK